MEHSKILSLELGITEPHAQNIIALIDEGCTIPFIARYRKEMTGSCDDQTLRAFSDRLNYLRNLDKRRSQQTYWWPRQTYWWVKSKNRKR